MYSYIKGLIVDIQSDHIVLENNGIGYLVYVSNPYAFSKGKEVVVYLYQQVKEDGILLYGFNLKEEKDLFLKLISVKGIGCKSACTMLASGDVDGICEAIEGGKSFEEVVKEFISEHKRIIFNGDGYSAEWEEEAKRRGLPNHKNTVDALKCLKDPKYVDMLDRQGVYTKVEIASRYEILLDNYIKTIQVEALTAVKMVKTQIYPAACDSQ